MSDESLILVLDAGTTSTRAMIFACDGAIRAVAQQEITQHYPQPGWVEHDAAEIWERTLACARAAIEQAGGAETIAAIGITNQRETVVAWDRSTGEPLTRAIVWQDRRTADLCAAMKDAGREPDIQAATGLLLDPYFSATKIRWMHDNDEQVRSTPGNRLAFGTIESWLVYKLSGGSHISDASNASRTMLLRLDGDQFDDQLCQWFGLSAATLPRVVDTHGMLAETQAALFGRSIPITALVGDQQAATIGQGCLAPGETKATFGTGAFVLTNKGHDLPRSDNRLLGTVLMQEQGQRTYALEGSVFVAGSLVKWLRDSLGLIGSAAETEELARSVPDSGGVVIVPALSGLGAPHWRPDARAAIVGMSFSTTRAHIARAALEAMAMQALDLAEAFAADGAGWTSLRIDGGMSANDWMAQDLADVLGLPVERPAMVETTALGAAMLAGVGSGLFASLGDAAAAMRGAVDGFAPQLDREIVNARIAAWRQALKAS